MKRFAIEYEVQATEHPFGPFVLFKEHEARVIQVMETSNGYRHALEQIAELPNVSGYSEVYRIATEALNG